MKPYENISDEELLKDISDTRKEIKAYDHLVAGYDILSGLSETPQYYRAESKTFALYKQDCEQLLSQLIEIAEERDIL